MTEKRFKIKLSHIGELMDCETKTILAISDIADELIPLCDLLNDFDEYIRELKQEVELLGDGLKAYDENLPLYLSCKEIRDFNSDLFEFTIKRQEFYKEHPRLCKIIVDGKELEE